LEPGRKRGCGYPTNDTPQAALCYYAAA